MGKAKAKILKGTRNSLIVLMAASLMGNNGFALAQQAVPAAKTDLPKPVGAHKYVTQEAKADLPDSSVTRLSRPKGSESKEDAPPTAHAAPAARTAALTTGQAPATAPPLVSHPTVAPAPPRDKFPTVGQLETLMFGHANPNQAVDGRLDKLENAIFQKSYADLDTETRIKRLKEIIVGTALDDPDSKLSMALPPPFSPNPPVPYNAPGRSQGNPYPESEQNQIEQPKEAGAQFQNFEHLDLKQSLSIPELEKFGLTVINDLRSQEGLESLLWDDLAHKIADEQTKDLAGRSAVSHLSAKGENPDVRYSKAGGADALDEGLILFTSADHLKVDRELVVKILEAMERRQDDRDSFFSRHATHFSMSVKWTADHTRLICCTEVVTKHARLSPIPLEANLGDKIEVKGTIDEPYKFHKITLAWEGPITVTSDDLQETDEAMPYFPPLDYEAHAAKSERDWEKSMRILQIAGITAAIAGGFFIPPVALAAPLIAASAGVPKPKPVSEIPVKGGVKTDGVTFNHKVSLNNDSKEGIYYLTVWGSVGTEPEIVPLSRRAIIARKMDSSDTEEQSDDKKSGKKNSAH